jgi:hypothetical protein
MTDFKERKRNSTLASMHNVKANQFDLASQKQLVTRFFTSRSIAFIKVIGLGTVCFIGVIGLVSVLFIATNFSGFFKTSVSAKTPAVTVNFEMTIKGNQVK